MKFIAVADAHVHPFKECSKNGGQDRLQDGLSAVRQTLQAARERNCPWVFLGDLKHLKDRWVLSVLNGLLALFEEYADIPKILLHGNHDGVGGGKSGLEAFRKLERTTIITEPCVLEFAGWRQGWEQPTAWWPYQPTLDGLPAFLDRARQKKAKILFAHAFLSGAAVGPTDIRLRQGATLEQFGLAGPTRVFTQAYFGDVHKGQALLGKRGVAQVFYPGSPYAQNWGELEEGKGAAGVDTETGAFQFVSVQAPRFFVENWIAVTKVHDKIEEAMATKRFRGHFIRLLVGPRADPKSLEILRETSGARSFQVVVQRENRVEQRADIHAGLATDELLRRYVQARPPQDGLDSRKLLAAGKKLLEAR